MCDCITKSLRSIFANLYYPLEFEILVSNKDIFDTNALAYMEKMNSYDVMDTKIMDKIMKEYWTSNIDLGDSFFLASTCYNILFKYDFNIMKDYEAENRFYHTFDLTKMMSHGLIMRVWTESMQLRFFIDLVIYVVMLAA